MKKSFGLAHVLLGVSMKPNKTLRIGSLKKQFTAVAILMLQEEGKLSLKEDFCKYLPNYPKYKQKITIENLLTHTSGIPNFLQFSNSYKFEQQQLTTHQILEVFKDKPLEFKPGKQLKYTNSGYNILGAIVERVSGMSYEDFVEKRIFKKTPYGIFFL